MKNYAKSKSIFDQVESYLQSKYLIRFNEIALNYEYATINSNFWKELNLDQLYIELEREDIRFSFDKLLIYLRGTTEKYDPIENYFHNELGKWDGEDYIDQLAKKIKLNSSQDFFETQFKKFLVRTVLCACEKKKINKHAIILFSLKQNIGKSTFLRYLVPAQLANYYAENISNDKDSIIKVATNFLINLDEMQNFMSSDLEFVKALVSKEMINERLPYGKKSERIMRRASFVGSTNKPNLLKDNTNVRWLIFDLDSIDFSYTEIEIDKVWAQAFHLAYKSPDFQSSLSAEELAYNEINNKKFRAFTREEEEILGFLEESANEEDFLTVTEICFALRKVYVYKNPVTLGKLLNNIGFKWGRFGQERTKKYCLKLTDYYHEFFKN